MCIYIRYSRAYTYYSMAFISVAPLVDLHRSLPHIQICACQANDSTDIALFIDSQVNMLAKGYELPCQVSAHLSQTAHKNLWSHNKLA